MMDTMASSKYYFFHVPLLAVVCVTLLSACQKEDTHPGQPVTKRVQIFKENIRTFEAMGLMVRNKEPYAAKEFLGYAQKLKDLSTQPWAYFTPGSDYSPTRALPSVWEKPEAFKQAQEKFIVAAAQLADVAQSGDIAQIKPIYTQVKESCAACHQDFRSKSSL
jgi:cytochrome c556